MELNNSIDFYKESGTEGLLLGMGTNIYLGWEKDLQ